MAGIGHHADSPGPFSSKSGNIEVYAVCLAKGLLILDVTSTRLADGEQLTSRRSPTGAGGGQRHTPKLGFTVKEANFRVKGKLTW